MPTVSSASEFFDQIIERIGNVIGSFNRNAFPATTASLISEVKKFIADNRSILKTSSPVEQQLRDAAIDLEQALDDYQIKSQNPKQRVGLAFQQRNFVDARSVFKEVIRDKFFAGLKASAKGVPSPQTVWNKTYNRLVVIISP